MSKKTRKKSTKGKTKSQQTYEWLVAKGKEFSADLRKNATKWELQLYKYLKELGYKFEFQVPVITNKKNLYILDFLLVDYQLGIEADGKFHDLPENRKRDNLRSRRLKKEGYHIIRLANKQIATLSKETIDQIIKTKIMLINTQKIN